MAGPLEADHTVTDDAGRVLVIREVGPLEEMDLLEAAGEAASSNRRWMVNATLYACVRSIDGVPRPFPTTRQAIRHHIEAVGGAGISAVVKALSPVVPEAPGDVPAGAGPASDPAEPARQLAGDAMGRVAGN